MIEQKKKKKKKGRAQSRPPFRQTVKVKTHRTKGNETQTHKTKEQITIQHNNQAKHAP